MTDHLHFSSACLPIAGLLPSPWELYPYLLTWVYWLWIFRSLFCPVIYCFFVLSFILLLECETETLFSDASFFKAPSCMVDNYCDTLGCLAALSSFAFKAPIPWLVVLNFPIDTDWFVFYCRAWRPVVSTSQVCHTSSKDQKGSPRVNSCVSWESVHTSRNDDRVVQRSNKKLLVSMMLAVSAQSEQLVDRLYRRHRRFVCDLSFAFHSAHFLVNGVLICCDLVISVIFYNEKMYYRSHFLLLLTDGLWIFFTEPRMLLI